MWCFLNRLIRRFAASRTRVDVAPVLSGLDGLTVSPCQHDVRRQRAIEQRLTVMTPMAREVYLLRIVDHFSSEQIAHRLAIPLDEVTDHLVRAIDGLAEVDAPRHR